MISNFIRSKIGPSLILAFISLLWPGALHLRAEDRYVVEPGTPGGTNEGPYTDWAIAATQIQWAVNAATNSGDTVWVSNGTYVLTNQINVISNIVLRSTNGPDGTIVNGGFVEGAPDATTNNRCLYLSNLSALVSGFTFSNGGVCTDGGGGVWLAGGILSNCTVRNNIAYSLTSRVYGGGIYIRPYGTTVACLVADNIASNSTGDKSFGAGISGGNFAQYPGWEVYGCVVSNNRIVGIPADKRGGGIYAASGKIMSSLIYNNSAGADGYGGGVALDYGALLNSCTVSVNEANLGGGIYLVSGTTTNCLVSSNYGSAGQYPGIYAGGAGVEVYNTTVSGHTNTAYRMAAYSINATNKMINCIIENNDALGVELTGVSANYYSIFIVSNCVVRNNKAGGISCTSVRNVQLRNCLIANNTNSGTYVGLLIGASGRTGTISVSSCTIASNYGANYGAGIRFADTNGGITVSSCVIASNGVGGTNDVYDMYAPTNYNAFQYSCVGLNPGFTGAAIVVASPQFADFAGGNFRLSGNSPCINAGSNETWMTNAFDLEGRTRIRYGRVDMGAYETTQDGTLYGFH